MSNATKSALLAATLAAASFMVNAANVPGTGTGAYREKTVLLQDGSLNP
jgi:hypothetical protein